MTRVLAVTLLAVLGVLMLLPTAHSAEEFRGLYVDAFHPGLLSHEQVTQMVNSAKQANFNALFVQVRKRGDAYYQSSIEPRAVGLAADYDPLADVLAQAHAAGLQVHAWLAVYEVAQTTGWNAEERATHVSKAHTDWLMVGKDGATVIGKNRVFVDPGLPAVRDNFVAIVRDIVTKYNVDGIHLETPGYKDPDAGYNTGSVALFNEKSGRSGIPETTDEEWRQWRASQVTELVRKTRTEIKSLKPTVKLSASVSSFSPQDSRKDCLQEWDVWAKEGLVDFLVPMLSSPGEYMTGMASTAASAVAGKHIYVGIGTYRLTPNKAAAEINAVRASTAKGVALFSYHYLQLSPDDVDRAKMSSLRTVFAEPASVPAVTEEQGDVQSE